MPLRTASKARRTPAKAAKDQGATGTTTFGDSATGVVVDNTGLGAAQTALRLSGIAPEAFHAAGAATATGVHATAPTAPPFPLATLGLAPEPELLDVERRDGGPWRTPTQRGYVH